jgi:hypothetical protein
MPITVPPFQAYQAPLIPLPGKWNAKPVEGDKFVPAEIDWGVTTGGTNAVQFALSSFSPVEFSQIVALYVDNGRNGSDVDFLFPDTGKQLTVPAYCQGLFPVITNSLTFYCVSALAGVGDVTIFEILNSLPPPIAVLPSQEQSQASATGIAMTATGSTQVIPPGTIGTIQSASILLSYATGASAQTCDFQLIDGNGTVLFAYHIAAPASTVATLAPINLGPLRLRFFNGVRFVVTQTTMTSCVATVNLYYSVP